MANKSPTVMQASATNGYVRDGLLTALVERVPYVLKSTEVLIDLTQPDGLVYLVIHSQATGFAYYYNADDNTTPDDGITCLVDFEGRRYLVADGADLNVSTVLAQQNTPAVSPVVGDSYIVGTSPTGAWVAHANDIALWTLRGWVFAQPIAGQTVYNQATNGNQQFDDAGNWVGFAISFSDGSIPNSALVSPFGIAVEAQQNAPPVSPTSGQYYLVGTSPSGAWVGHANDVAFWNGTAWVFYDPYDGATVYNKSTDLNVNWNGTAWVGAGASSVTVYDTPGSFTWNKPLIGSMVMIQCWGAGGSGGKSIAGDAGGGGGGGSYNVFFLPLAQAGASETVTVGAGGPSRTTSAPGAAGGNSSFGTWLTGYGGGGGFASGAASSGGGGGGGGQGSAGATSASSTGGIGGTTVVGIAGAVTSGADSSNGGASGGDGGAVGGTGGKSDMGGGGGGGAHSSATGGTGGNSGFGGAGGGGGGDAAGGAGGTSLHGGNGGAGATSTTNATNGAQPGGGGGGSETGNSGSGGAGRVIVTVF